MEKCQQLLRENRELGRELAEAQSDAAARQLLVARGFAADLQAALHEMRDAAVLLEEEQVGRRRSRVWGAGVRQGRVFRRRFAWLRGWFVFWGRQAAVKAEEDANE